MLRRAHEGGAVGWRRSVGRRRSLTALRRGQRRSTGRLRSALEDPAQQLLGVWRQEEAGGDARHHEVGSEERARRADLGRSLCGVDHRLPPLVRLSRLWLLDLLGPLRCSTPPSSGAAGAQQVLPLSSATDLAGTEVLEIFVLGV